MIIRFKLIFIIIFFLSKSVYSNEKWFLDKDISTINFEVPVFLAKNVKGQFKNIEGIIEIDTKKKENIKGIFSVDIKSIEMNYSKYKDLLMSEIFFHEMKHPIALINTNKFSYENELKLKLIAELIVKDISDKVPINLEIIRLAEDLIQIKGKLIFSRTNYEIGKGNWSSTAILKDEITVRTNLFLFRN